MPTLQSLEMARDITRKQHYVPQFLLKNFSLKVKKHWKINVFDTIRKDLRLNQSVDGNFYQNNFYDKDNSVESLLSEKIENPASLVIQKIISSQDLKILRNNVESQSVLLKFISTLLHRTPQARDKALSFIYSFFDSFTGELLELNDFDREKTSIPKIRYENKDGFASFLALQGVVDACILVDLDFHLVKNNTSLDFWISDHPAFSYNWFYKELEHPGVTGLPARGFQIFLPISTKLMICLYDPGIYKYGSKKSQLSDINDESDVIILNSLQALNSESIMGFQRSEECKLVQRLCEKYGNLKVQEYESQIILREELSDEKIKSTHVTFGKQFKLSKMPSFVIIKKKVRQHSSSFSMRSPELVALHQENRDEILKREKTVLEL
ncbi:MAG: DUF4238 domain-containing protein [Nodosilinea sp.]